MDRQKHLDNGLNSPKKWEINRIAGEYLAIGLAIGSIGAMVYNVIATNSWSEFRENLINWDFENAIKLAQWQLLPDRAQYPYLILLAKQKALKTGDFKIFDEILTLRLSDSDLFSVAKILNEHWDKNKAISTASKIKDSATRLKSLQEIWWIIVPVK